MPTTRFRPFVATVFAALALFVPLTAGANTTPQTLPFTQNWTSVGLITTNDNWSGVPGIEGYLGQDITTGTGIDPQTLLTTSAVANDLDVIANQTNPNTLTNGGVAEFDGIANPAVALQGSGTADAPYVIFYLNTTGNTGVTVRYTLRDLDGSTDNAVMPVALQFRVGASGNFTNVAAGFVADATSGPSLATQTNSVCAVLPATANNQAQIQVRVMTTNAAGNDEWVAVDDIQVDTTGCGGGTPDLSVNDVSLNEGNAGTTSFTFTVSLSAPAGPGGVTFDIATADGTAQDDTPATEDNDYVLKSLAAQTIPAGSSTYSFTVLVNGDTTPETNETFFVNVTNTTGATVTDGQGQGTIVNDDAAPNLTINDVSLNEGNAGTTSFIFTVSLSAPAGVGGVTFDIATADGTAQDDVPATEDNDYVAKSLTAQTIPAGSSTYSFTVLVNGDTNPETDETFTVNVTNVTNAIGADTQGLGTILNDDISRIHDVQGNGAATPIPGATVTVEGIVTANFQGVDKLQGFFLQEEDADADADPATSEGIFIFCIGCPTAVAEGQRVRATGTVSEFFNFTEITASTAGSVTVTQAGNNLAQVTATTLDLPVVGVIDDYYEPRESMLVRYVDTLAVAEYFELFRYGTIELYEGGRPRQFTEANPPNVAGNAAYQDVLARRRVLLDDDDNVQNEPLNKPDGSQFMFHPAANGGFSVGTQGVDFFRGGDAVNNLTGVLHWSFSGLTGTDAWRIRPTAATPVTFTVVNPRPATPPAVGGAIKAVGMNLLNYFTTIDTTSSTSSGPCGPSGTLDCRGADSNAELVRQRDRAALVICTLNADVFGFAELENTASTTITDLLGAVNTRCGAPNPYAFVNTGGTLGTDAIRGQIIYRTNILSPVGAPLSDLDSVHNRPPTAQTFDVVAPTNPAFGKRFTVVINHLKSKGCPGTGGDADSGDGQSCFAATRTAQATRTLAWVNSTVIPAAGDPDVLLLGDFNSYAQETPTTTITSAGYSDLETALLGPSAYSYLFDGQLGHLDYAFSSASLTPQVTGITAWHINADEVPVFDYNDEIKDVGEAAFEEKPDGSALVPPRVVFQPGVAVRASDHDPILVGLFQVSDLSITKTDGVTTATPGGSVTYSITAANAGPDAVTGATVADTFPAILTCTWTCVGAGGGTCTASGSGNINQSVGLPVGGSVTFTASCAIAASATGTLSNTATVSHASSGDPNAANNSATDTDTLTPQANHAITKTDGVTTATAGGSVTYTITASNAGPSNAAGATVADTFPASLTCNWTCVGAGGGTCTASGSGNINNTVNLPAGGSVTYTASCTVSPSATGTLSNTATVTAPAGVTDPTPGNNSATDTDTVGASGDLAITKTDGVTTATAGGSVTYTITASNPGPSNATGATVADTFPASLTCNWTCTGAGGGTCTASGSGNINDTVNLPTGGSVTYTASCTVSAGATGSVSNTATVTAPAGFTDPNPANNSATDIDGIGATADLAITKSDGVTSVTAGGTTTYTITASNAGPSNATGATVADTFPASLTCNWTCTGAGGGTCTASGSGNLNDTVNLPASGSVTYSASCTVSGTASGTIANTATVTAPAGVTDPNPANNSATDSDTVGVQGDLSITKTDGVASVTQGGSLTYTIVASNSGPSTATGATVTDTFPASLTCSWTCVGAAGGTCTAAGSGNLNDTVNLPTGGSVTYTASCTVSASATGTIVNTATVTAPAGLTDSTPGNNSATDSDSVTITPTVSVTGSKSASGDFSEGGTVIYTITLSNSGNTAQPDNTGDELTDVLPAALTLVSATANSGVAVATVGTNTVTWNGAIPAGGSVTITITATVDAGTPVGTTISNQANFAFDGDVNGSNESGGSTDDPTAAGSADPTVFVTVEPGTAAEIPTLNEVGLALLAALLAFGGLKLLRRRVSA